MLNLWVNVEKLCLTQKMARLFNDGRKTISMLTNQSETHSNINEDLEAQDKDRHESDAQKIVRRHLRDKNHVITEEEMSSIRIGVTEEKPEV